MKLTRFVLVAMLVLAFAILGRSEAGDSSGVLAHGQPPCTVTLKPWDSIQIAIDQAAEGAVICLEAGTYQENLIIEKGLTLRGIGAKPEDVRIVGAHWGYPVMRIESEREIRVKLENLTAAEAKGDRCVGRYPQWICPNGVQVLGKAKAVILNVQVSGNRWYGLVVEELAKVTITDSTVSGNWWHGLFVRDSAKVEINDSIINENKSCGVFVYSHEAQVLGTHNMMLGNGADLCGFAPAYLRKPLVPQDPRPTLSVPADYATVQQAIDAIVPGGTIKIAAGIYEEGLTIWKPVVLRGAGLDKTILQALPKRRLVLSIIAEVQGVRIEGLHVSGSQGVGLLIYGRDVTIQDALISKNWHGFWVLNSANVTLTNSKVSDNWAGLWVWESANVTFTNSTVSGNQLGLWVWGSAKVTIADSKVSNNRDAGLWVWGSAKVTITDSKVSGNEWDGLRVEDSAKVEVRSSTIEGNGTLPGCQKLFFICNGITVRGRSWVTIINSQIINNTDWGVAAWLEKCGYYSDDFTGKVIIDSLTRMWLAESEDEQTTERTELMGNNKAGNHEGEVCLP